MFNQSRKEDLVNVMPALDACVKAERVNWEEILSLVANECGLKENYLSDFRARAKSLENLTVVDLLRLLAQVYIRAGADMGQIVRLFFENELNWGYFADHSDLIFHNNMHPNNFVVLSPKFARDQLLAPLDFDIAFCKDEFINIDLDEDNQNYGRNDAQLFERFQLMSKLSLEMSLSGVEMMGNFKLQTFDFTKFPKDIQSMHDLLKVCLKDGQRIAYIEQMERVPQTNKVTLTGNKQIYDLIEMALLLTNEIVA